MKTGIELITEERQRQIEVEGWTKEHDAEHKNGELAKAAICYADPNVYCHQENRIIRHRIPNHFWPKQWDIHWFKPTDRIRDLVKAGALIAAEIDRLQALKENSMTDNLFDNAKFGDMFLTTENKQAAFLRLSENAENKFAILYVEDWGTVQVFRHNGNEVNGDIAHSIIKKQEEPVSEDLENEIQR